MLCQLGFPDLHNLQDSSNKNYYFDKRIKKLCKATTAFVINITFFSGAMIGLRKTLKRVAAIPNVFSITLRALERR